MTDLNPLGTLVSTDEFASCCSGEVSGEITHAHLNSITEAVRHRYGALATTAAERALSSDKASDTFYTEEQRNVLTDETAGASAGCGNPVGIADAKPGRVSSSEIKHLGEHPEDKKPVRVMKGQYGPYIKYKSLNATIPEEKDPAEINMEEALILIEKRKEYDRSKKKKKK